jgi:ubiquinone/menaquinone biosynthesis C-methylase UbiE
MAQTVENCASFVPTYIKPTMSVLDAGCGLGNLTCDFAKYVPEGSVIGLDKGEERLTKAREQAAAKGITNISFVEGDITSLPYPDGEFDIVHAHQVLHHVNGPVALREMRRVTKTGGMVFVRDASHLLCWPMVKEFEEYQEILGKIMESIAGHRNTGSRYRYFAREAGFQEEEVHIKGSAWCYATKSSVESYFSTLLFSSPKPRLQSIGLLQERTLESPFKDDAMKYAGASEADIKRLSEALGNYATTQDAIMLLVFCEMMAVKSD